MTAGLRREAVAEDLEKIGENLQLLRFMADHDAWRELAEIYVSLQIHRYKQAAFCYEELILTQPTYPLYHLAYADVLYTIGGLENLIAARKYYAATIDLTGGRSTRALLGICLCGSAIAQLSKGRNKEDKDMPAPELQSLAATTLEKEYKQTALNHSIFGSQSHRDTSLEADIMNVQAAILQFDEVASTLSLEDLHLEEREAIEEAVMCISSALRVGDWYEASTTNKRKRREEQTEWSE